MSWATMAQEPATKQQVRMIYGTGKKLGLDNDLLHARCMAVTGKKHISQLNKAEAARLIDALLGKQDGKYQPRRDERPLDRASQEQINLILGLARKLGWLEGGSKRRLNAFLRARWGVERLDWLPPDVAVKVTEALKAMNKGGRGERKQAPAER